MKGGWIAETSQIDKATTRHPALPEPQKGARVDVIGISRSGRTTKVFALVYVLPRPLCLVSTPFNTSNMKGADLLINDTIGVKRVVAHRSYDVNRIRAVLREFFTIQAIPDRRNRKRPIQSAVSFAAAVACWLWISLGRKSTKDRLKIADHSFVG
jgi:hypothetical protein